MPKVRNVKPRRSAGAQAIEDGIKRGKVVRSLVSDNSRLDECTRRVARLIEMVKQLTIIASAGREEVNRQRRELQLDPI